ncbi:MAG: NAD(P)-dependent oxidoreductase [Myxococcales bacterium]|nr:NAD(P)-dependent oxidoreductase [Myxococcales bacterium]MCB9533271.1 NAD(P)-dependent oxidoreductase [Myxococcales bacterium]
MSAPVVLITGASGTVGRQMLAACGARGLEVRTLRHSDPLESADWDGVSHVVNCAAVIPAATATAEGFWDGNVGFVERLLPWLERRHIVHFGTLSAFYRTSAYQVSKLLGEALLRENAPRLASLHVLPLPTLDDEALVASIAASAERGERPTVTQLRYAYCSPAEVARFVVDSLVLGASTTLQVEIRSLPDRVRGVTAAQFDLGDEQDRTCERDGWRVFGAEAARTFSGVFGG